MADLTQSSIDYNAETIQDAQSYLKYRYKQLLKFGVTVTKEVIDDKSITIYFNNGYGAIYILKPFRGQGLFPVKLKELDRPILTIEECEMTGYLNHLGCPYLELKHSEAYKLIQKHYGDIRAKRSGIPYIYHIDEGGYILNKVGANNITKDAFYVHPLHQLSEDHLYDFSNIPSQVQVLSVHYRYVANSYLSRMKRDSFIGFPNHEVWQMLVADKVQNYKDFMQHHYGKHERSDELHRYFQSWFELLEIDINKYIKTDEYELI